MMIASYGPVMAIPLDTSRTVICTAHQPGARDRRRGAEYDRSRQARQRVPRRTQLGLERERLLVLLLGRVGLTGTLQHHAQPPVRARGGWFTVERLMCEIIRERPPPPRGAVP